MDSNLIGGSCKHGEFFTCYYCKNDKLSADNKALREELEALKQSIPKIRADAIREAATALCNFRGLMNTVDQDELNEYANKIEDGL
jgi:hypothetical protein